MTPQEQQMLGELLNRISAVPVTARDPEADSMIQKTLGTRPDALYLLTQMALVHEITIKQAEQQIKELQRCNQPATQASSFLGNGPWVKQASAQQPSFSQAPQTQPSTPGFLSNVLTTASGVIAGEMAFSAVRSLFGGGSLYNAVGVGGNSFLGTTPRAETTINNYYENDDDLLDDDMVSEYDASDFSTESDLV